LHGIDGNVWFRVFYLYLSNISKGKGMKNCGTIIVGKSTNPKMKTLLDFISRTTKIKIQQSEIPIPEAKPNKQNEKKDNQNSNLSR